MLEHDGFRLGPTFLTGRSQISIPSIYLGYRTLETLLYGDGSYKWLGRELMDTNQQGRRKDVRSSNNPHLTSLRARQHRGGSMGESQS